MAERLFRRAAGERHEARSAGVDPGTRAGSRRCSRRCASSASTRPTTCRRRLDDDAIEWADVVVATCDDACPVVPGQALRDWHLQDPKGRPLERGARDPRRHRRPSVDASRRAGLAGYAQTARAVSSAGRAPALQAGGRRFEPVTAHQPQDRISPGITPRRCCRASGRSRGRSGPSQICGQVALVLDTVPLEISDSLLQAATEPRDHARADPEARTPPPTKDPARRKQLPRRPAATIAPEHPRSVRRRLAPVGRTLWLTS